MRLISPLALTSAALPLCPPPAQTEAQRWIERLHTLYSSGAVVPLPFLRATDAAPLELLGLERGPPPPLGGLHLLAAAEAAGPPGSGPQVLTWGGRGMSAAVSTHPHCCRRRLPLHSCAASEMPPGGASSHNCH